MHCDILGNDTSPRWLVSAYCQARVLRVGAHQTLIRKKHASQRDDLQLGLGWYMAQRLDKPLEYIVYTGCRNSTGWKYLRQENLNSLTNSSTSALRSIYTQSESKTSTRKLSKKETWVHNCAGIRRSEVTRIAGTASIGPIPAIKVDKNNS